jgi:serine/threonine-protein kinase
MQAILHLPTLARPDQLWAGLKDAGLLTQSELNEFKKNCQQDAAGLIAAVDGLVAGGRLTPFQRELLLAGEGRQLCLGQYRLRDRLGCGGMGCVYLAEHIVMERLVAVKVIADRYVSEPEAIRRFRREVRIAARLNHPNIVQAHDAAESAGLHFLVMEYVPGIELDSLVKCLGPLPEPLACVLMHQAALALQHAVEQGLTHGDMKPANMLVLEDATLKILDFGLGRWLRANDGSDGAGGDDTVAGTPEYLSPEVARDPRRADIRSDLYSLGCTFFYILATRPPYTSKSWAETLLAHQRDPVPDLRQARPDLSEGCWRIIQRLLAKSPSDRFQSPTALAAALEKMPAFQDRSQLHIPVSSIKRRSMEDHQVTERTMLSLKPPTQREVAQKTYKMRRTRSWQLPSLKKVGLHAAGLAAGLGLVVLLSWAALRHGGKSSSPPNQPGPNPASSLPLRSPRSMPEKALPVDASLVLTSK